MDVHIDISDQHMETSITIHANSWSDDLDSLVKKLKSPDTQRLFGEKDDQTIIIHPEEIEYFYAQQRKVYAVVNGTTLEVKYKLYEIEELLSGYNFSKFSKSAIGNLKAIVRFEVAFNGNLCVYFGSGKKEYVSRKYVPELKKKLIHGGV